MLFSFHCPGCKGKLEADASLSGSQADCPQCGKPVAIPEARVAAGTTLGLMLRAGNNSGPHVDFGVDKAVTKKNGLTLHPYWERASNCGVRWKLVE